MFGSLISLGYIHSNADYSLSTKSCVNCFTTLLAYVDELVLAVDDLTKIMNVKYLGPFWYFLMGQS